MSFKKGQTVHHIGPWDNVACMVISRVTVASCGKQRLLLVNERNETFMGHQYLPTETQRTFWEKLGCGTVVEAVFAGLTDAQAEAKALEMAQAYKAGAIAFANYCIERHPSDAGYVKSMQEDLAFTQAATPSFRWR